MNMHRWERVEGRAFGQIRRRCQQCRLAESVEQLPRGGEGRHANKMGAVKVWRYRPEGETYRNMPTCKETKA